MLNILKFDRLRFLCVPHINIFSVYIGDPSLLEMFTISNLGNGTLSYYA